MNTIIQTEHLSHTYRSGSTEKVALNDVSLQIERGSCAAIIGVTGSGKTTLVQHFNGLLRPTNGNVIVDGVNVGASGVDLRILRQHVGMLFQFPEAQLFEHTIYADVAFGPRRMHLGKHEIRARVQAALDIIGLPHKEFASRSPFDLSGGQRRRIALAGVLAMSPRILILDEPTAGLDADAREEFYRYLKRVQERQQVTIILVTHDMSEVATLADTLFVLSEGRLVMQGSPRQLFAYGDQLGQWGLAAPPLSELLAQLRDYGVPVPHDTLTLNEAFAVLSHQNKLKHL